MPEHEFFGVRFCAVEEPQFVGVPDSWFQCAMCGGRFEFETIATHAKYHRWEAFQSQGLELRIAELEKTIAEMVGADVLPIGHARPTL